MSVSEELLDALVVGRYRVQRQIGKGGGGIVYLAADTHAARMVALKVTRSIKPAFLGAIDREAAQLTAINHPHIVRIYDSGRLPDGRGFLALEWIDGVTLETYVGRSGITLAESINVAETLADILVDLHSRNILYRDLKPRNVLIPTAPVPQLRHLTLVDFGLARSMAEHTESGEASTDFGRQTGTPVYMAPEQLAGRRHTVASDVYALGGTLFYMLYGSPPMGEGVVEWTQLPLDGSPPRICTGPYIARRLTEDVQIPCTPPYPHEVTHLLRMMLERNPRQRVQTALEVRRRLRAIQTAVPM